MQFKPILLVNIFIFIAQAHVVTEFVRNDVGTEIQKRKLSTRDARCCDWIVIEYRGGNASLEFQLPINSVSHAQECSYLNERGGVHCLRGQTALKIVINEDTNQPFIRFAGGPSLLADLIACCCL